MPAGERPATCTALPESSPHQPPAHGPPALTPGATFHSAVMFCKNASMLGALMFYLSMKRKIGELEEKLSMHSKKTN